MTRTRSLIFTAIFSLGLTGCTYFDAPPPTGDDAAVDAMNHGMNSSGADQMGQGDRIMAKPIYPSDYSVLQSNSAVEVYSLDDGFSDQDRSFDDDVIQQPQTDSGRVNLSAPKGISGRGVPAGDPSVEIFPLDGRASSYMAPSYMAPSATLTPEPKEHESSEISETEALNMAMIHFAHNSAGVKEADLGKLYKLATAYREQSVAGFSVEGHASERSSLPDPVERQVANLKMSMTRAYEVAKVLMQSGVDGDDIVVKAYGSAKSGPGDDESSRRVDVRPVYN
jgi:outer membrane protein OmpA-like peptidoglycan-associated protein